jgi:hypothetical protein
MATPFENLKGRMPSPTPKKELLMQMTTDQKATLNLIRIAQGAETKNKRNHAVLKLWDIHGPKVMGITNSYSIKEDADWDLRGLSHADRQKQIMSNTFMMFHRAVMNYDTHTKVPFMAYVANTSKFQQKTEKRNNAKRTGREVVIDFSGNTREDKYGDNPQMIRDLAILREADCTECQEIEAIEARDTIDGIERFLKKNSPKLLTYFRTSYEFCQEYGDCRDIDVAVKLGCTRANVGVLRKKLENLLREAGLYEECRLAFSAAA